jgi:hypothetical protein
MLINCASCKRCHSLCAVPVATLCVFAMILIPRTFKSHGQQLKSNGPLQNRVKRVSSKVELVLSEMNLKDRRKIKNRSNFWKSNLGEPRSDLGKLGWTTTRPQVELVTWHGGGVLAYFSRIVTKCDIVCGWGRGVVVVVWSAKKTGLVTWPNLWKPTKNLHSRTPHIRRISYWSQCYLALLLTPSFDQLSLFESIRINSGMSSWKFFDFALLNLHSSKLLPWSEIK